MHILNAVSQAAVTIVAAPLFAAGPLLTPAVLDRGRSAAMAENCLDEPHQAHVAHQCGHASWALRRMQAGLPPTDGGIAGGGADPFTDVLHYSLALEIVPSNATLSGTNEITVQSLVNGLSSFGFQLDDALAISTVKVNNVNAAWTRLDPVNVNVNLGSPMNAGQQFTVAIAYSGAPVSGQGFSSINFWTQGGQPLIFTLSEPWYSHTWWPVKEDSNDKATADLHFTVPSALSVASNGTLQGTDAVAVGKTRYRWKTDYPTSPYLFSFSATNYSQFNATWTYPGVPSMPLSFFIFPADNTQSNRDAWLKTVPMLTTFSDLFGTYAFADEKYGIYQFGFGGGMEHQTMTGQGSFGESLTAHELAHQWWGDTVTCGTWSDIWLNEGFATYSEALWYEFRAGSSGTPALLNAMQNRKPTSFSSPCYVADASDPSDLFSTNFVYRKGAWVLHMLRHVMGDVAFFDALNLYRANHEYGTAITADFQAACESMHDSDLTWFFDQWVYEPGAAAFHWNWRNITAGGSSFVELYVVQTQNAAYPTFAMPVDVEVTIGGVDSIHTVWNDARSEHLLFPVPSSVSAVAFDPDEYVLTSSKSTTSFVEGPPKIVATLPLPGTNAEPGTTPTVSVVFHKNVSAPAGQFTLTGAQTGPIACTFAYSSGSKTATLTPLQSLVPDVYTLAIGTGVTETTGGIALDGEMTSPGNPQSLPSGNGQAGGAFTMTFTVVQPLGAPGDVNGDGLVGIADLLAVIGAWGPCPALPAACPTDVTDDGVVGIADVLAIIGLWG